MAQKQQNIEQVKVAINTLLENHQKVSVKAISELSGISKFSLYTYTAVRQYVRHHSKRTPRFLPKIEPTQAPVEVRDEELEKILSLADNCNPFNDGPKQEKPNAQPFEMYFQMPLSKDKYFKMSFPSDIDDEDKQDITDYLSIIMKRKLKV